jgi:hypothetical protein
VGTVAGRIAPARAAAPSDIGMANLQSALLRRFPLNASAYSAPAAVRASESVLTPARPGLAAKGDRDQGSRSL